MQFLKRRSRSIVECSIHTERGLDGRGNTVQASRIMLGLVSVCLVTTGCISQPRCIHDVPLEMNAVSEASATTREYLVILIHRSANGGPMWYVGGTPRTRAELCAFLRKRKTVGDERLFLKAHDSTMVGDVRTTLDLLRAEGYRRVSLFGEVEGTIVDPPARAGEVVPIE